MTLFLHEMRLRRVSLVVWTVAIDFFIIICIAIWPEMKAEVGGMDEMFSTMGAFTDAFGLDTLRFSEFRGYYAIECGNILGIGGALFAALSAISSLSSEEGGRTAEFLFSHPLKRTDVLHAKGASVLAQLLFLNLIVFVSSAISAHLIDETILTKELCLLHLSFFLMQTELDGICFLISALLRRTAAGLGLGIAITMYFLNLIANISDKASPLKVITPFSYCEASEILLHGTLDMTLLLPGMIVTLLAVLAAYAYYVRKDLH